VILFFKLPNRSLWIHSSDTWNFKIMSLSWLVGWFSDLFKAIICHSPIWICPSTTQAQSRYVIKQLRVPNKYFVKHVTRFTSDFPFFETKFFIWFFHCIKGFKAQQQKQKLLSHVHMGLNNRLQLFCDHANIFVLNALSYSICLCIHLSLN
jgi:hypothetical protein